jgi:hypothetical protein
MALIDKTGKFAKSTYLYLEHHMVQMSSFVWTKTYYYFSKTCGFDSLKFTLNDLIQMHLILSLNLYQMGN